MSLAVFAVVLLAAAVHATWNALLKGSGSMLMRTIFVAATSGVASALVLPFVPAPDPECLPYLAASVLVQTGYYVLLANAYRVGDMSRTYPLMRGLAPVIVAIVSTVFLDERIGALGWLGVALVSLGIFSLVLAGRGGPPARGTGFAVLNAITIATYTMIDGVGVRAAGSIAYVLWLFVLCGGVLAIYAVLTNRTLFLETIRATLPQGITAGLGNLASYALVLWAMTQAPIPLVAALRETSILFGTAIAAFLLRERVGPVRALAACIIAAGAITLRLA